MSCAHRSLQLNSPIMSGGGCDLWWKNLLLSDIDQHPPILGHRLGPHPYHWWRFFRDGGTSLVALMMSLHLRQLPPAIPPAPPEFSSSFLFSLLFLMLRPYVGLLGAKTKIPSSQLEVPYYVHIFIWSTKYRFTNECFDWKEWKSLKTFLIPYIL